MLGGAIGLDFPVFENIDQAIGIRFVERHLEMPSIVSKDVRLGVNLGEVTRSPLIIVFPQFLKQKGVISWLDADDVVGTCFRQVSQVWDVAAERVLDDN